jgi:hypothetical protein
MYTDSLHYVLGGSVTNVALSKSDLEFLRDLLGRREKPMSTIELAAALRARTARS